MADKKMLMPAEIAEYTIEAGVKKATTPNKKVLVLVASPHVFWVAHSGSNPLKEVKRNGLLAVAYNFSLLIPIGFSSDMGKVYPSVIYPTLTKDTSW